jgi:phospholipid/cholesterol/gamma-HCH transport system permease protein
MAAPHYPTGVRPVIDVADSTTHHIARAGHMVAFFFRTVAGIPLVLRRYPREFLRLS